MTNKAKEITLTPKFEYKGMGPGSKAPGYYTGIPEYPDRTLWI